METTLNFRYPPYCHYFHIKDKLSPSKIFKDFNFPKESEREDDAGYFFPLIIFKGIHSSSLMSLVKVFGHSVDPFLHTLSLTYLDQFPHDT